MNIQESGRTLVEMLGVLAIIGVLSAGVMSAISYGMQSYRAAWAYQLVEDTAQGVSDLYSWKRSLDTDSAKMATLICENDVMDGCTVQDNAATVSTPWGVFKVQANSVSQYNMILTNVPEKICDRLKDMNWSSYVDFPSSYTCSGTKDITFTGY